MKANMLLWHRKSPGVSRAERYKAWVEYRTATPPKSDDWSTATALLGRQYLLDGDYREALALLQEFLRAEPENAWVMLDVAESDLGLGKKDAARDMIRAAEKTLPANPARQSDKEFANRIRVRIKRLQDKMAQQPK